MSHDATASISGDVWKTQIESCRSSDIGAGCNIYDCYSTAKTAALEGH